MPLTFQGVHQQILDDDTPEQDVEGARECGKTWLDCAKIIRRCVKYPGMQWYAGRYTDGDTMTLFRPAFMRVLEREGVGDVDWNSDENAFHFPLVGKLQSKVFMHGLKAQTIERELSKVRGLDKHAVLIDQAEELPQKVSEELRFVTRLPGDYPRQVIFSPNPCTEDHYLTDQFPDECLAGADPKFNRFPHRVYYRLSLYDNRHNLQPGELAKIEAMYPPSHARYKSLVLGLRGVNVNGVPCHAAFNRELHHRAATLERGRPVLEAIQHGQHHPTWIAAQRTYAGGLVVLAGLMGKRMSLDEFLPIVKEYRSQWFEDCAFLTCTDPPPSTGTRYTNINILQDEGFTPTWHPNALAPDVREAVIQALARLMRKPIEEGFTLSDDATRFVMASRDIRKPSRFLIDGLESAYVWDDHMISVGNKRVRQPKPDEWIEGAQRCLENITLNFCAYTQTDADRDRDDKLANPPMTERERKRWDALDERSRQDIERWRAYDRSQRTTSEDENWSTTFFG